MGDGWLVMSPSLARCRAPVARGLRHFPALQIRRSPLGRNIEGFQCRSPPSLVALPVFLGLLPFRSDAFWPPALMLWPTRRMQARASADRSRPNGSRGSLGFTLHSTPTTRFRRRLRAARCSWISSTRSCAIVRPQGTHRQGTRRTAAYPRPKGVARIPGLDED